MKFLYRFEVRTADAELFSGFASLPHQSTTNDGKSRSVYLLTNYEQEVALAASDPFSVPFLQNNGYDGYAVNGWVRFQPTRISHDEMRLDSEDHAGQLNVSLPVAHPLCQLFALDAPPAQVWLTLAMQDGDAQPLVIYVGRVRGAEFAENACKLTLMPLHDVLKRPGLTQKHSRTAYGSLIDHVPEVNAPANLPTSYDYFRYREDGFVAAISPDGITLTVPEAANRDIGFFSDGLALIGSTSYQPSPAQRFRRHYPRAGVNGWIAPAVENWQPSGGVRRGIVSHDGATLTLSARLPAGVAVGDRVTLYCGVPARIADYAARFGSVALYNGFPYIPEKNPYQAGIR